MKDYRTGLIRCKCSHAMRKRKYVKIYEYAPEKKRCPNCNKNRPVMVRKEKQNDNV